MAEEQQRVAVSCVSKDRLGPEGAIKTCKGLKDTATLNKHKVRRYDPSKRTELSRRLTEVKCTVSGTRNTSEEMQGLSLELCEGYKGAIRRVRAQVTSVNPAKLISGCVKQAAGTLRWFRTLSPPAMFSTAARKRRQTMSGDCPLDC